MTRLRRSILIGALAASAARCPPVAAQSAPDLIREGNEQFRQDQFQEALRTYQGAAAADPNSLEARFNQGVAAYYANDLDASERMFREVDAAAGKPDLAAAARYNLGVLQARRLRESPPEKPEQALDALRGVASRFRSALDLAPRDADAARNLELTRRSIQDLQQQIEQMKQFQQAMKDLQQQLEENQEQQQQAATDNQQRAQDQTNDPQQQQEAQSQQQAASQQTESAQQTLEELRQQAGESQPDQPQQQPTTQERMEQAAGSLEQARERQEKARQKIEQGDLDGAQQDQQAAAQSIREAIEHLAGDQQQQPSDQPPEDQPQEEQPQQQPSDSPQEQQPQPAQEEQGEQMEPAEGDAESSTDARLGRILEKERRDREHKQDQLKRSRARNRPVEKDW